MAATEEKWPKVNFFDSLISVVPERHGLVPAHEQGSVFPGWDVAVETFARLVGLAAHH